MNFDDFNVLKYGDKEIVSLSYNNQTVWKPKEFNSYEGNCPYTIDNDNIVNGSKFKNFDLKGSSIKWNQLVDDNNGVKDAKGIKITKVKNHITVDVSEEVTGNSQLSFSTKIDFKADHKYIMISNAALENGMLFYSGAFAGIQGSSSLYNRAIISNPKDGYVGLYSINFYVNSSTSSGHYEYDLKMHDLTEMFGAGNEPTTVAEFEAIYNQSYYEYDSGSIVNVSEITVGGESGTPTKVELVSKNLFEVDYYDLSLNGVGTVKDELDLENGTITRRIGVVDLGTLSWASHSTIENWFQVNRFADGKIDGSVLCLNYINNKEHTASTIEDGEIIMPAAFSSDNARIVLKDSNYTYSSEITEALSGQLLYYELATPTTRELTAYEKSLFNNLKAVNPKTIIDTNIAKGYVAADVKCVKSDEPSWDWEIKGHHFDSTSASAYVSSGICPILNDKLIPVEIEGEYIKDDTEVVSGSFTYFSIGRWNGLYFSGNYSAEKYFRINGETVSDYSWIFYKGYLKFNFKYENNHAKFTVWYYDSADATKLTERVWVDSDYPSGITCQPQNDTEKYIKFNKISSYNVIAGYTLNAKVRLITEEAQSASTMSADTATLLNIMEEM